MANMMRSESTVLRTTADEITSPERTFASRILSQESFAEILSLERKRTERSNRRFVLLLVRSNCFQERAGDVTLFDKVRRAIAESTRDTDVTGWYQERSVIGVIFTEIGAGENNAIVEALTSRVTRSLAAALTSAQRGKLTLSFHVFPTDPSEKGGGSYTSIFYPELEPESERRKGSKVVKRAMDILGSIGALVVFSPILAAIAVAVKLSSKGPILFKQVRIGQRGQRFTFLKFRSMYTANDPSIHKEYVKKLILEGKAAKESGDGKNTVYKLTNDPRITKIGRFLRRSSLDELPQFMNVLLGDMSLVGPRPPVPYEFECYDLWHRRRLLEVKPGITGLWQVGGRSSVKFDEMVRLDLKYAQSWSPWMDIKILLQTPKAVVGGDGAY